DDARREERLAGLRLRRGAADLGGGIEEDAHATRADRQGMELVVERGAAELLDRQRVADHAAVDPLVQANFPAREKELRFEDLPVQVFRDDQSRRLELREEAKEGLDQDAAILALH